ncbi:MAG: GNAT family N-acetyltransferase [Candidatus Acidiferrales bacterium]
MRFITRTVAYVGTGRPAAADWSTGGSDGAEWQLATPRAVQAAFRDDPQRHRRFHFYLKAKYWGLILIRDGQWISYGWCSHPQSAGPPHLPRWIGKSCAPWIFGCHTHPSFRQRGFYKQMLSRLMALIRQQEITTKIYIDTRANNVASRRAILTRGFEPCGVITTYRAWVPLVGSYVVAGRWRRGEEHPDCFGGTLNVSTPAMSAASFKNPAS